MTFRPLLAAILFLATSFFAPTAFAIDESLVIDPNGTEVEQAVAPDSAVNSILSSNGSSMGLAFTVFGCLLIVGAIIAVIWILFKRGVIRKPFANVEGKLKVAETRMLGNRQFIMVVEYEEQKILLGVGPGKIDYLTSLGSYRSEFPAVEQEQVTGGGA